MYMNVALPCSVSAPAPFFSPSALSSSSLPFRTFQAPVCTDLLLATIFKLSMESPANRVVVRNALIWKNLEFVWNWLSFAPLPCQDFIWLYIDSKWPLLTYQDWIVFTNQRFSQRSTDRPTPKMMVIRNCFRKLHVLTSMNATLLGHHYKFLVAFSNIKHGM